jgi:predicted TIM-barrel fold metal-dependent hydrolase
MRKIDFHTHLVVDYVSEEEFIRTMDDNEIERAVVLAVPDHPRYSGHGNNETVLKFYCQYPDRIIPGIYIDPRTVLDAQDKIKRARDLGVTLVKAWPAHGFRPDDPKLYPVWELMHQLQMAIVFHSGTLGGASTTELAMARSCRWNSSYGHPMYIDEPARLFPNLTFIYAHTAYPYTLAMMDLSYAFKNVYVDFSCPVGFEGFNVLHKLRPARLEFSRMLFGSDTAGGQQMAESCQRWEKLIQGELFEQYQDQFMYKSAKALLDRIGAI